MAVTQLLHPCIEPLCSTETAESPSETDLASTETVQDVAENDHAGRVFAYAI